MSDQLYSRFVKEQTVRVAQQMLERVGCGVTEFRAGDRVTLDIVIPPDPVDPHGERLMRAMEAASE